MPGSRSTRAPRRDARAAVTAGIGAITVLLVFAGLHSLALTPARKAAGHDG